MHIWEKTGGISNKITLKHTIYRMVESQRVSSTRKLVDAFAEHEILEKLLDQEKPPFKFQGDEAAFKELHYLLATPFRYPPLKFASRFCGKYQRNLFYSSLELKTAMAEKAYYRFALLHGSEGQLGEKHLSYTAFTAKIQTSKGINLCEPPFLEFRNEISSPIDYKISQMLGSHMRADGIEAFLSYSARCKENGKNVNIFSPRAFESTHIESSFNEWRCFYNKKVVEFTNIHSKEIKPIVFSIDYFYFNEKFPSLL